MASRFDQENQQSSTQAQPSRFGVRKDNGQPKLGLSIVNANAANKKKQQTQPQLKKVLSHLLVCLHSLKMFQLI